MSNFVTIENSANEIKLKNLFNVAKFIGFIWILFHFTIVFFFGLVLESPLLSGLFLCIGNFVAFLIDIPIGVVQKYIKAKTFLILASVAMFVAMLIFIKFIYFAGIKDLLPGGNSGVDKTISYLGTFLNSSFNVLLLILASVLYGVIKELYDVTALSYILNNSTPSEYATLLSKYNINYGIGAMVGILGSGIILAINTKLAVLIIIFLILCFIFFVNKFFDNTKSYIGVKDIKELSKIKLDIVKDSLKEKKDNIIKGISIENLKEISKTSKVIFLKPIELKSKIDINEIIELSKKDFYGFKNIIFSKPFNIVIIWVLIVIFHFGFWDTFVSTFQLDFLKKIITLNQNNYIIKQTGVILSGYLMLGILIIPAFLLQDFFIGLSKKKNIFNIIIFGILISGVSMFFFGFVDKIYFVLFFGIMNSIGYAAVMPLAQGLFSEKYNYHYAEKNNLNEIDTTVSAAPLKIVTNIVNVIGLFIGSILVGLLGFNVFFVIFALSLFGVLFYSFKSLKKLNNDEKKENISIDKDFI